MLATELLSSLYILKNQSLVRYVAFKYFLPLSRFFSCFHCIKAPWFEEIKPIPFGFKLLCLGSLVKKPLTHFNVLTFLPHVFFYVSGTGFTFTRDYTLDWTLATGRERNLLSFLCSWISSFPALFIKDYPFNQCMFLMSLTSSISNCWSWA